MASKKYDAVVLLSGGMDSCTALEWARRVKHYIPLALSLTYGSKHEKVELEAAAAIASDVGVDWQHINLPPQAFRGSALTDGVLPLGRTLEEMKGVAPSYVPMRNTVLVGIAGAIADGMGASHVVYGAHVEDHVGYPDCRPEWVSAMSTAMMLGSVNKVQLEAPFITVQKQYIVKEAVLLGAPLHLTHSCYQGKQPACGVCDTCTVRIDAFKTAGYIDPILYDPEVLIDWDSSLSPFPRALT